MNERACLERRDFGVRASRAPTVTRRGGATPVLPQPRSGTGNP
jgi:hypothetical protein